MSASSIVFFIFVLIDKSFIQAVRFTPLGTVGLPAEHGWFLVYVAVAYGAEIALVGLIIYSRHRSTSRRYRQLALIPVLTYISAFFINIFMNLFLPPVWRFSALALILSDSATLFLIARYRLIQIDYSLVEPDILTTLDEAVVLVDSQMRVVKSNRAVAELLLRSQDGQKRVDLASLFDHPEPIRSAWQQAVTESTKARVENSFLEAESLVVTLMPYFDRFRDLVGGTVVARRDNQIDSAATRFGITAREKQVTVTLMLGYRNPEIADTFPIALGTVETHVHNIYRKTGDSNRVELVRSSLEDDETNATGQQGKAPHPLDGRREKPIASTE